MGNWLLALFIFKIIIISINDLLAKSAIFYLLINDTLQLLVTQDFSAYIWSKSLKLKENSDYKSTSEMKTYSDMPGILQ